MSDNSKLCRSWQSVNVAENEVKTIGNFARTFLHLGNFVNESRFDGKSWKQPQVSCIREDASEKHEKLLQSRKIFSRFICLPSDACSVSLTPINWICASNYFDQLQQSVEKVFRKVSQHLVASLLLHMMHELEVEACANIFKNLPSSPKFSNLRNGKFNREVFGSSAVISFASWNWNFSSGWKCEKFPTWKGNYLIFPVP